MPHIPASPGGARPSALRRAGPGAGAPPPGHVTAASCSAPAGAGGGRGGAGREWGSGHRRRGPAAALAEKQGGGGLATPDRIMFASPSKSRQKQKPPNYRVMLHNDSVNDRNYVVKVLLKTIPNLVLEDAYRIMEEAHTNGMACVIVCPQEEAEGYCDALRKCSLTATIEPVSKGD